MGLDLQSIIRNKCRLCVNPTDLTLVFPHGGTALGYVRDIALEPGVRVKEILAEEYGGEPVSLVYLGARWTLAVIVRQWWDNTTLGAVFPNTADASGSGQTRTGINHPGTVHPGTLLEADNFSLLLSPEDEDNPAVYIKSAVAVPDVAARLNFRLDQELEYAVVVRAFRHATVQAVQVKHLRDITL